MSLAVPSWMATASDSPGSTGASDAKSPTPERPNQAAPRVSVTKMTVTKPTSADPWFIQLTNKDGDSFYTNLTTGDSYWLLPQGSNIRRVRYITHLTEEGQPYYECMKTKDVTWTFPGQPEDDSRVKPTDMTIEARNRVKELTKLTRADCIPQMKDNYNEEDMVELLNDLDNFAHDLDMGVAHVSDSEEEEEVLQFESLDGGGEVKSEKVKTNTNTNSMNERVKGANNAPPIPKSNHPDIKNMTPKQASASLAASLFASPDSSTKQGQGQGEGDSPNDGSISSSKKSNGSRRVSFSGSLALDGSLSGARKESIDISITDEREDSMAYNEEVARSGPRQLIMSGFLEKQPKEKQGSSELAKGGWKRRYFVLSKYCLAYYTDVVDLSGASGSGKPKTPKGEVHILPFTVVQTGAAEFGQVSREFILKLTNTHTGEMMRLSCSSRKERDVWMDAITNTARNLSSGGPYLGDTINIYQGILSGYKKRYFIFHKGQINQYADDKHISEELLEDSMKLNRNSAIDGTRTDENKMRCTVLRNGTDNQNQNQGRLKYEFQFESKANMQNWLSALQNSIDNADDEDVDEGDNKDESEEEVSKTEKADRAEVSQGDSSSSDDAEEVDMNPMTVDKDKRDKRYKRDALKSSSLSLSTAASPPAPTPIITAEQTEEESEREKELLMKIEQLELDRIAKDKELSMVAEEKRRAKLARKNARENRGNSKNSRDSRDSRDSKGRGSSGGSSGKDGRDGSSSSRGRGGRGGPPDSASKVASKSALVANKPIVRSVFDAYARPIEHTDSEDSVSVDFNEYEYGEERGVVMDTQNMIALHYDHGFFIPFASMMQNMHMQGGLEGVANGTPSSVAHAHAHMDLDSFSGWWRENELIAKNRSCLGGGPLPAINSPEGVKTFGFLTKCVNTDLRGWIYLREEDFKRILR